MASDSPGSSNVEVEPVSITQTKSVCSLGKIVQCQAITVRSPSEEMGPGCVSAPKSTNSDPSGPSMRESSVPHKGLPPITANAHVAPAGGITGSASGNISYVTTFRTSERLTK